MECVCVCFFCEIFLKNVDVFPQTGNWLSTDSHPYVKKTTTKKTALLNTLQMEKQNRTHANKPTNVHTDPVAKDSKH